MMLIHVRIRPQPSADPLPADLGAWLRAAAHPEERIEHVTVHRDAHPHPTLGVFLIADSLAEGEARAAAACRRLLASHPRLAGWELVSAEMPLITHLHDRVPAGSGPAGQKRPWTFSSS
jgi:hypothetical protein